MLILDKVRPCERRAVVEEGLVCDSMLVGWVKRTFFRVTIQLLHVSSPAQYSRRLHGLLRGLDLGNVFLGFLRVCPFEDLFS